MIKKNVNQLWKNPGKNVFISWLYIGQTRLMQLFILKQEEQLQFTGHHPFYTVKHFLIECADLALVPQLLCIHLNSNESNIHRLQHVSNPTVLNIFLCNVDI